MFHVSDAAAPFHVKTQRKFKLHAEACAYALTLGTPAIWDTRNGGSWVRNEITAQFMAKLDEKLDEAAPLVFVQADF